MKMNKMPQNNCLKILLGFLVILLNFPATAQGLKTNGKKIVDENGNEVILRGMGLGGWMLQEPYMMEMSGIATAQWDIKAKISALIGPANTDAFYNAWLSSHCTKKDIDSLAAWGFNSVRLPLHYNLFTLPIEDEPLIGQNTWLDKGFAMTDSLINWCKSNHMYVILDLHAAPGGQGKDAAISDYNASKPSLWESELNKEKTIALWAKLAERYANEPWVGGYDLINEPNWSFTAGGNQNGCSENLNLPLKQLYKDITTAIRAVDSKHMIIIEGNCWGNSYNGLFPLWDNNMVLSFHKYWSNNDQGSIQGMLNFRNQYNVPIWLGESGENSNSWYTDAISLVESNGIGWAWWPMKKIGSISGPLAIVKTANYQTLLDYWNNGGTAPSAGFAYYALLQQAENAKIQNCIFHKDVIDAMFRQVHDSATLPFTSHTIPGNIAAPDYDLGRLDKAYYDTESADYHVSSGTYTSWNTGWSYRNDGVDIQTSTDTDLGCNGYNVGWTADNEWLKYSADVDSSAAYAMKFRYAISGASSKIKIFVNDAAVTGTISLPSTGGYQSWTTLNLDNIILYKGNQKIKVYFEKGGANFSYIGFTLSKKIEEVMCIPISAETYGQTQLIYLSCNKMLVDSTISASDFTCTINGNSVNINSLTLSGNNCSQIVIDVNSQLFDIDDIRLNYSGDHIEATDGTLLQSFTNFPVKNNLPVYLLVPGKIEAEAFSVNQGLQLETTTDVGGGKNVGYTNAGDYLDYRIRVMKSSKYYMEVRVASAGAAGRIEVQQINSNGAVINSALLNIPITGGWQVWKTIGTAIDLIEGPCTLRVKIVQPEFNMNWYKFSETAQGLDDAENQAFDIFPNPASEELNIIIPGSVGQKKTISVWSTNGTLLKTMEAADSEVIKQVFIGDLPKGFYIVQLQFDQNAYRKKLIIQ
jgi:aryl-phospho-beta-D-glucosidase BglC (GH1 family)